MVQLKLNSDSKSKPATDKVSKAVTPKAQSKEELINEWRGWFSIQNTKYLVTILYFLWRLLEMTGYGPLFLGLTAAEKHVVPKSWESWEPSKKAEAVIEYSFVLLAVVMLQLDAFFYVFICYSSAEAKLSSPVSRTDLLFKYIRYCIPQVFLGGLVLLQPHGSDLLCLQLIITMIWNTCATLLLLIQSYMKLLEKKRAFEKQYLPQKISSDEMPAIIIN